jgi:hypothetical protein
VEAAAAPVSPRKHCVFPASGWHGACEFAAARVEAANTVHNCPYGSLCVDAICQVIGCGSHNGIADCTGNNVCVGERCVVAECGAVSANCAKGFHCQPADPPFSDISGTCVADQVGVSYCAWDTDCIAPGNFNPTCMQGVCTSQTRRLGRCESDGDCPRWCRRGRGAMRLFRCDAAGMCVCSSCIDDAQCGQLLACPQRRTPTCLPSGTCACRKLPRHATTTTVTTTTETTETVPSITTSTTLDTTCCCNFGLDSQWHCVHSSARAASRGQGPASDKMGQLSRLC